MFCKKGVLRNFAKFIGKHLCQSLFFNKVAGLRPATLLKKRFWYRSFPVNFAKTNLFDFNAFYSIDLFNPFIYLPTTDVRSINPTKNGIYELFPVEYKDLSFK